MIIAVVLQAVWALGKVGVKGPLLAAVGLGSLGLSLLGWNEIALLFGGGLLVMLVRNLPRVWRGDSNLVAGILPVITLSSPTIVQSSAAVPASLSILFLIFLKIGAVLYGSGYVLLAFLRNDFVTRLGWLTCLLYTSDAADE